MTWSSSQTLQESDPEIFKMIEHESERQKEGLEMIDARTANGRELMGRSSMGLQHCS